MKSYIILAVLYFFVYVSFGQQKFYPVIGEPLPDFTISKVYGKPGETLSLADLKGKYTILDFWWVGCVGCIKSFPKMDSINNSLDDLNIILVGKDGPKQNVEAVFEKYHQFYGLKINSVFDEAIFKNFKISSAPTLIWIDPNGIVKAITGSIGSKNDIDNFLNDRPINAKMISPDFFLFHKANYKRDLPLLTNGIIANGNESDTAFLFRSLLTEYKSGMMYGSMGDFKNGQILVEHNNASPVSLFRIAYGTESFFNDSIVAIETKVGNENLNNFSKYYCYSLKVPSNKRSKEYLRQHMKSDLYNYFGCKAEFQDTLVTRYALVDPKKKAQKKTREDFKKYNQNKNILNNPIHFRLSGEPFSNCLNIINGYLEPENRLLDETSFSDIDGIYIDMEFPLVGNDQKIYEHLLKLGFNFEKRTVMMKKFIIREDI